MERINLNVPTDVRRRLKRVADWLDVTESEAARRLLVSALERSEREEFYRRVAAGQTPKLRERQLELAAALDRADEDA